jgi:hypothetical protein
MNGFRISSGLKWAVGITLPLAVGFCMYFLGRVDKVESDVSDHNADSKKHHATTEEAQDTRIERLVDFKVESVQKDVKATNQMVKGLQKTVDEFKSEQRSANRRVLEKLDEINGAR